MQAGDAGGRRVTGECVVYCIMCTLLPGRYTPASAGLGQSGYSEQSQRWLGAVGGDMSGYTGLSTGV